MKLVGLVLASLCLALTVVELGLRFVFPAPWQNRVHFEPYNWLEYNPLVAWENRARYQQEGLHINSLHFKGDEIAARKDPGVLRIACLGDSRTFGTWLDLRKLRFDNDYPAMLGTLIQNDAGVGRVEVINAGVVGYSSSHGLRQLVTQLLDLHPDIITVSFGFNDHSLAWNAALSSHEPRSPIFRNVLYDLKDLRLLQLGMAAEQAITFLYPAPLSVHWVELDEYAYNLRRFAEVGATHGIRVLFVSQSLRPLELGDSPPAFPEFPKPPPNPYALSGARDLADLHRLYGTYQDVFYRVVRDNHLALADAAAVFAQHRGDPLFSAYDAVHPNVTGARVIAETIHAQLIDRGWLGGDRVAPSFAVP